MIGDKIKHYLDKSYYKAISQYNKEELPDLYLASKELDSLIEKYKENNKLKIHIKGLEAYIDICCVEKYHSKDNSIIKKYLCPHCKYMAIGTLWDRKTEELYRIKMNVNNPGIKKISEDKDYECFYHCPNCEKESTKSELEEVFKDKEHIRL